MNINYLHFSPHFIFISPLTTFFTKVYHCNVNNVGRICHNIFDRNYSAHITMREILDAIFGLLIAPEPEDPLDRWTEHLVFKFWDFSWSSQSHNLNVMLCFLKHFGWRIPVQQTQICGRSQEKYKDVCQFLLGWLGKGNFIKFTNASFLHCIHCWFNLKSN